MRTQIVTLAAVAAFGLAGTAAAQFVDGKTTAPAVSTVKQLLKDAKDDQKFVAEGYIVERVKDDDYRFRDATGTIVADIDDDVFNGAKVTPDTRVRIEGEVDTEVVGDNTLDVERLTVLR